MKNIVKNSLRRKKSGEIIILTIVGLVLGAMSVTLGSISLGMSVTEIVKNKINKSKTVKTNVSETSKKPQRSSLRH